MFFREGKRFMQQDWRITSVKPVDDRQRIKLKAKTDAVPGELRESARHTTVFDAMMATVDGVWSARRLDRLRCQRG